MKKLLTLLLAAALSASLLVLPASAYVITDECDLRGFFIEEDPDTKQFWDAHESDLWQQEIQRAGGFHAEACADFHDGLLLVYEGVTPTIKEYNYNINYVDKNANLVDLNQGRYYKMYSFSGGFASVIRDDHDETAWLTDGGKAGVGYIDTQGKEVISYNKNWYQLTLGYLDFAGRFENGKAVVLRKPQAGKKGGTYIPSNGDDSVTRVGLELDTSQWGGLEYAYINTSGKVVSGWTYTCDPNELLKLPLYDQMGVSIQDRFVAEQLYWGKAQTAASAYQSTAQLTAVHSTDMDYDEFDVTVTNPTDTLDRGTVALVVASNEATVSFIDYEVEPHSSRTYSVCAAGHVGHMTQKLEILSGLEKYLNATIITFESDEDLADFKASIPREIRGHHYDGILNTNDGLDAITVCYGAPGDTWLKTVGISWKSAPYLYAGDNHNQCKA